MERLIVWSFVISFFWTVRSPAGEPVVLRTLCQEGYAAKFNPGDKEKPGVAIEMIHALEKIEPSVRVAGYEKCVATARLFVELEANNIDVLFALAKNPERLAQGVFIDPPLYTTYQKMAVRAGDSVQIKDFDGIRKLGKDGVILVAAATAQAAFLKTQTPALLVEDGSRSTRENLMKLVAGRGRFYYGSDIGMKEDIEALKIEDKIKVLPASFQREDVYVIFSKKVPASTIAKVKAGIEKLQRSGELKKIHSRYIK